MNLHFSSETTPPISPEQAQQRLADGNQRFVAGQLEHPRQDKERRRETLTGQHPFAVVLTCSDSRLSPEILFDQGIGDLFVIRNAGNVLDEIVEGSIAYAVEHLHAPLVVVLGHSRCGAVTAAVHSPDADGKVGAVVRVLQAAVISARNAPGDTVLNTAIANVQLSVARLRGEPAAMSDEAEDEGPHVIGAVYHVETGLVEFL
jgi:carbonic anhydrase